MTHTMPPRANAVSPADEVEFDLLFPPIPEPERMVFAAIADAAVLDLVRYHHELLYRSSIGDLFPRDPKRFAAVVERIAAFVLATVRGDAQTLEAHGAVWFRSRHLPLTIDETARNVWLGALLVAFDDVAFPEAARQALWNWVEVLSIRAITRRTMVGQPRRYPWAEAREVLRPFEESARRNAPARPA